MFMKEERIIHELDAKVLILASETVGILFVTSTLVTLGLEGDILLRREY